MASFFPIESGWIPKGDKSYSDFCIGLKEARNFSASFLSAVKVEIVRLPLTK